MSYAEPDGGTHPEVIGAPAPAVVAFDVNETLSDTTALGSVFDRVGLPAAEAPTWFARVLRDGFAAGLTGGNASFAEIARELLPGSLSSDRVEEVVGAFARLPLHADVVPGLRALVTGGVRVVTLSNGAAQVAQALLAGVDGIEAHLSVADAPAWKPHPDAYRWAAERCGVEVAELMLVAVHPWDVHGAATAGARTAWVHRDGPLYPSYFTAPELAVRSITALAARLTA